jgi:hypothetical protein
MEGILMITTPHEIQISISELTRLIKASQPIYTTGIEYQSIRVAMVELSNVVDSVVRFE